MILKKLKQYISAFLDLVYPNACTYCARELLPGDDHLCLHCLEDLPIVPWQIGQCLKVENQLKGKMIFEFTYARYYYHKFGKTGVLLKQLKYRGNKSLGIFLGRQFGVGLVQDPTINNIDFILPIPLHPKRQLKRGYNQTELIAKGIHQIVAIPIAKDVVIRSRHNVSQTGKGRIARSESSQNLFLVQNPENWEGKHFLVLDDVITTGATMESFYKAIISVKNVKVSIAALCCPYD